MSGEPEILSTACPQCKKAHIPRGKSLTLAMTCTDCNTYFSTGKWSDTVLKFKVKSEPALPIGGRGKLNGDVYEVMGFVQKYVKQYRFYWREYVLFNPAKGVAYLSESSGHWNFVVPHKEDPQGQQSGWEFQFEGLTYRLYQKFTADVIYARGEFFNDIFDVTLNARNHEYISPPYFLSSESDNQAYRWFKGEYINQADVASAFNLTTNKLPKKEGRGYTQPFINSFTKETLITVSVLLALLLVALQLLFHNTASDKIIYQQSFNGNTLKEGQKMFVTPAFEVEGGTKSLVVNVSAPISNDWFFGDFVLVDEKNQTEYEFSKEIEYYFGSEGGESWTEGSKEGEAFLSQIPAGRYHLNIYPEFSFENKQFTIEVRRDVPNMSNMWSTLVLIGLFPAYYFIRRYYIESKRWSDSDYSPFE